MITVATMTFQGEPTASGPLGSDERRELRRAAFPLSPPRDATRRDGYRALKCAPLSSGRFSVSVSANTGEQDEHGRPVLRAVTALIEPGDMRGALRDVVALWCALTRWTSETDAQELGARAAAYSPVEDPARFADLRAELARSPRLHAALSWGLGADHPLDVYLGDRGAVDALAPALLFLPLERLLRLELCVGGVLSHRRERCLALPGAPPADDASLLPRLVDLVLRSARPGRRPLVAFGDGEVTGLTGAGPRRLVEELARERGWPGGVDSHDRLRLMLEVIDAPARLGRPVSLFDVSPELRSILSTIRAVEGVDEEATRWT